MKNQVMLSLAVEGSLTNHSLWGDFSELFYSQTQKLKAQILYIEKGRQLFIPVL